MREFHVTGEKKGYKEHFNLQPGQFNTTSVNIYLYSYFCFSNKTDATLSQNQGVLELVGVLPTPRFFDPEANTGL